MKELVLLLPSFVSMFKYFNGALSGYFCLLFWPIRLSKKSDRTLLLPKRYSEMVWVHASADRSLFPSLPRSLASVCFFRFFLLIDSHVQYSSSSSRECDSVRSLRSDAFKQIKYDSPSKSKIFFKRKRRQTISTGQFFT
jgi:hypothetical protein